MATRAEPRDYIDVANALDTYSRQRLVDLAHQADPDLDDAEISDAMLRLDRLDDSVFTEQYRLSSAGGADTSGIRVPAERLVLSRQIFLRPHLSRQLKPEDLESEA